MGGLSWGWHYKKSQLFKLSNFIVMSILIKHLFNSLQALIVMWRVIFSLVQFTKMNFLKLIKYNI
jgi:hypothetical protein